MEKHHILCLDLGTTTGYALAAGDGASAVRLSSTWNLKPSRFEGGGMRFVKFTRALNQIHETWPISRVYFEAVRRHRGTDAAHVYGGLMGMLTAWCEERLIPYEGVGVGAIKKFWTGTGNADKEAMCAEARRRGYTVIDDNEADAIALRELKLSEIKDEDKQIAIAKRAVSDISLRA